MRAHTLPSPPLFPFPQTTVTLPGLSAASPFDFSIFAFDNYFTGNLTDSIENMTFTLATPRFTGSGVPATGVPVGGTSTLTVSSVAGGDAASPSQKGLLLQAPPILGGIALVILALPLIWNCARLVSARGPRY